MILRNVKAGPSDPAQVLMNVLTRFAEEYPMYAEKIQQIMQEMMGRPETEETSEETIEPQIQVSQQQ